jgi:hypothetical protein
VVAEAVVVISLRVAAVSVLVTRRCSTTESVPSLLRELMVALVEPELRLQSLVSVEPVQWSLRAVCRVSPEVGLKVAAP